MQFHQIPLTIEMKLQLSGQSEIIPELHKIFYDNPRKSLPRLVSGKDENGNVVDVPRNLVSCAYVIERRINAPQDVIENWQKKKYLTCDGFVSGTNGDRLIVLDAQALHEINLESKLYKGSLILSESAWEELKEQKDKVVYLTSQEVEEARSRGYIKNKGVWTPMTAAVGKIWDALSRGRDLTSYIQLVSDFSYRSRSLLEVYLNDTKYGKPTMRPFIIDNVEYMHSNVCGGDLSSRHIMIGVAPEPETALKKTIRTREEIWDKSRS